MLQGQHATEAGVSETADEKCLGLLFFFPSIIVGVISLLS